MGDLKRPFSNRLFGGVFFAQDGASKVITQMRTELEVCFPNGTVFPIVSDVRHVKTDSDRQVLSVGFEFFCSHQKKQEKQLWEYVREIRTRSFPHGW